MPSDFNSCRYKNLSAYPGIERTLSKKILVSAECKVGEAFVWLW